MQWIWIFYLPVKYSLKKSELSATVKRYYRKIYFSALQLLRGLVNVIVIWIEIFIKNCFQLIAVFIHKIVDVQVNYIRYQYKDTQGLIESIDYVFLFLRLIFITFYWNLLTVNYTLAESKFILFLKMN